MDVNREEFEQGAASSGPTSGIDCEEFEELMSSQSSEL